MPDQEPDVPQFKRVSATDPSFWDQRFAAQFTPWDRGGSPENLHQWIALNRAARRKTLIPGCGAGHEVVTFAEAGWPVTAIDFSVRAVERAKSNLGIHADFVVQADFFAPDWVAGKFELIYENAFLCALPPERRQAWADQVSAILQPGGLLVGYFFFGSTPKGPPFAISREALADLLSPNFSLRAEAEPPDSIPVFLGRERWMVWERQSVRLPR